MLKTHPVLPAKKEKEAAVRLEKSIIIQRPLETVFAFVTDMSNVTRWTPALTIRQITEGPIRIGSQFAQDVEIMGKRYEIITQVTAYEPNKLFGFKAITGPFPLENTFTFTPVEAGTQVSVIGTGEPGSLLKMAGPLLSNMIKKRVDTQANLLKQILETS
jgi:ligand-binding SRPBCC domain-containing protein